MSDIDFKELRELIDTIHNQPITRLENFARLSFEIIRRGWNVQTVTYTEFWDWLQEYEDKLGRGVVMVIDDQLGYLKAEYALPYANEDFGDAIQTYEMGEEYVIAAVLKADGKTMRLAYRKGYRVSVGRGLYEEE